MRKLIVITIAAILFTSGAMAADIIIGLSIKYNHGISDFFTKAENTVFDGGEEFLETRKNNMGYGLDLSVAVPVRNRIFVVPGISLSFGHQNYEYTWQTEEANTGDNDVKNSYFFKIFSGEVSLMYCLLPMDNGWNINVLGGLNYNKLTADEETLIENKNYLGLHLGIATKFFQQKHLGFQFEVLYRMPFASDMPGYISGRAGFLYKLNL